MKLRIHKNSLRFRVTRGEVETLYRGEPLEERIAVGPRESDCLAYRIVPDPVAAAGAPMRADLNQNTLTLHVPSRLIQGWRDGQALGAEAQQDWDGGSLRLLLEKDMQRLNPKAGEEPLDVFPNPLFGKERCDHL
jgi:hypothetical protein